MSRTIPRRSALAGAALSLALGLGACGGSDPADSASAVTASARDVAPAAEIPSPAPAPQSEPAAAPPTAASPAPAPTAAPRKTPPTTAARTTTPSTPATTPAPPTTVAPLTPKFAPGQRINPSPAQVQAAITSLTQRIPLFKPNETQLRTFADAACTNFDQGQTFAQVSSTIRQAVTYVQGASLTVPDSDFAARTVVTLRCPGYLP